MPCLAIGLIIGLPATAVADGTAEVEANLARLLPQNQQIISIAESPMPDVYEVELDTQTLYVYSRGQYLMIGDVYATDRRANLGEEKKNAAMVAAIAAVPEDEMIVMGDVQSDRHVTVFTDTDCGYCQRFHRTIDVLAAGGLKVRYLMFPRTGLDSESYDEAVSVWCSEDQGRAMTIAKSGGIVSAKPCDNPVARQYQLGQKIGLRGTPTMILDNGKIIPGYVAADKLLTQAGL